MRTGYLGAVVGLALFSAPAFAYQITVDQMVLYKNGNLYVNDTFGDGSPPPSSETTFGGGGVPVTYGTAGTWSEAGGRALVASANSPDVQISAYDGSLISRHVARINSSIQDGSTNGLRLDDAFTAVAAFDLSSILDLDDSSYNLRIRDSGGGHPPDDEVRIGVRRSATGDLSIRFGDFDFSLGTGNVLDSDPFAPPVGADQIVFMLDRAAPDGGDANPDVLGYYAFVNGPVDLADPLALGGLSFTQMSGSVELFHGEDWTRAELAVLERTIPAPEPATFAVFALGLVGLGFARRRRGW